MHNIMKTPTEYIHKEFLENGLVFIGYCFQI